MIFKCFIVIGIISFNLFEMVVRLIPYRIDLLISLNKSVNTFLIPIS